MDTFSEFLAWERASQDCIDLKLIYVDMTRDLRAGLLLSQIVYWHLPDRKGRSKLRIHREGHDWVAKAHADWWEEIRIPERTARTKIKDLEDMGLIETRTWRFNGLATTHLRLREEDFLQALNVALMAQTQGTSNEQGQGEEHCGGGAPVRPNRPYRADPQTGRSGHIEAANPVTGITETSSETTKKTETTSTITGTVDGGASASVIANRRALAEVGIGEPKRSQLANLPHVCPEDVAGWGLYAEANGMGPGFLVRQLEAGVPVPAGCLCDAPLAELTGVIPAQ